MEYAKKIVENDRKVLNNIPNYGEIAQTAKCVEEAASGLEQDSILAEQIKDPLLPSEDDKDILSNIGIRMELFSEKLHKAIAAEKKLFEKGHTTGAEDSRWGIVRSNVSRMEEAANHLGTAVPGGLSTEFCDQIIEAAKVLQKLPDDLKDLRSAHEDIDNRALAFIVKTESGVRQDTAVMQQAIQGLRDFAEEFRKLESNVRVK